MFARAWFQMDQFNACVSPLERHLASFLKFWAHFASARFILVPFHFQEGHLLAFSRVASFETVFILYSVLDFYDGAIARCGAFCFNKPIPGTPAIKISGVK